MGRVRSSGASPSPADGNLPRPPLVGPRPSLSAVGHVYEPADVSDAAMPDEGERHDVSPLHLRRWPESPATPAPGAPASYGNGAAPNGSGPATAATDAIPDVPVAAHEGFYLRYGKRTMDVVVSLLAILCLLPLVPIIALLIRLDSPGAIVYRCKRVGRGGKAFCFYKLRSMVPDAHASKDSLLHLNEVSGPVFKVASDPRITRIGRFLRRSSLDEIPQLVHVLRGEMTLVGPRPPEPEEVLQYAPEELRRLSVRPGLTCLWQISGRSLIGFDEWMKLDLEYIDNRSFMLDLKILLKTIPAVLSGKGAY